MAVFIKRQHDESLDYHEWWTNGDRVRINCIGHKRTQGWNIPNATIWRCNNTRCTGMAYVPDAAVVALLAEAVDRG